ncbi:MAG: Flp pilus assembly protein CpaB [Planctomycetota bacterium]|jgi:pilus assembly protein CpaB
MKWGIVILLALGVVAAVCASVLVGAVKLNPFGADPNESSGVEVMVAKRALPAMTTITANCFEKKTLARADLPTGRSVSPTGSLGRVLAVSVVKGQVLTESCLVWEGTGAQLAAKLPDGMRAFTVHLRKAIPDRVLLYPGCVVDVLFSSRLSSRDVRGQAISATILRGIQVLAVAGDSVVSNPNAGQAKSQPRESGRGLVVTLLVDPKQAEALQLASDNGTISLAIRNPLDKKLGDMEATVLSQGQLANLSSALTPEVLAAAQRYREESTQYGGVSEPPASDDPNGQDEELTPAPPSLPTAEYLPRKPRRWGVTVIRGRETKVEDLTPSKSSDATNKTEG